MAEDIPPRDNKPRSSTLTNNLEHSVQNNYYDEWAREIRCGVCGRARDENNNCILVSGRYKT